MTPEAIISFLRDKMTGPLPGESAHLAMAPLNRPLTSIALQNTKEFKESAVSILLHSHEEQLTIVLIQRPFYEGAHGGQISFPGGKKDQEDVNSEHTARRECMEEIGVCLEETEHLGQLTDVYIPVSGFLVKPHVYYTERSITFVPDPHEVAEVFRVSVVDLLDESCISTMEVKFPNGLTQKNIPCFILNKKKVWGATALILNELRELLS